MLKSDGRTVFLSVDDIKWIGAAGERRGRRRRMGDAAPPPGRCQGLQEVSQMKLQMKREALQKLNRVANESAGVLGQVG